MYFLLEKGNFQPAMLDYRSVAGSLNHVLGGLLESNQPMTPCIKVPTVIFLDNLNAELFFLQF